MKQKKKKRGKTKQQATQKLLSMLQEVWGKTKDIPAEEIEKEVDEAIKAIRGSDKEWQSR